MIEQLGGTSTPAVGFAAGIERILIACKSEESFIPAKEEIDIYLIRLDNDLELKIYELATFFRSNYSKVEFDYLSRSVKAQMREANKLNAKFVLFVGGEEYSKGEVQLKNMSSGEQQTVNLEDLRQIIKIVGN